MITNGTGQGPSDLDDRLGIGVDALVQSLRLPVDDAWIEDAAATERRQRVPAESVLRFALANVTTIITEWSGWVIERAAASGDSALRRGEPARLEIDHLASCDWMHERPSPRGRPEL